MIASCGSAGDQLPAMVSTPSGPRARRLSRGLARWEAPGINAVPAGGVAMVWQAARGANVWDTDGNRYIDLTAGFGVAAVGHAHPAVVAAIEAQSRQLLHGLGDAAAHPLRIDLARRLARRAPVDEAQVYWAVSGADAVEVAIKSAVLHTGRAAVLAFDPGYHGLSLGALAATSRPAFRRPFRAQLHRHVRRLPFGAPRAAIAATLEDRAVACALVEPVVGREGVLVPADGWLAELARSCRRTGTLLAADEIFTGFGRMGSWFAVDRDAVRPDLLCCGKALGGGLPIGAVVGRRDVFAAWKDGGEARHTGTFIAHPLAMAAGLTVLDLLARHRLPARADRLGASIGARLAGLAGRHPIVADCRGRGLLWGIETLDAASARGAAETARAHGVLVLAGGPAGSVLQIAPPLTISRRQLTAALDVLEHALDRAGARLRQNRTPR